jgi:acyl-CoA synthetase (AMP-forming)/AMP-acid ligase II
MFRPLVNQIGFLRLRRAYTGGAALGPELFTFYQAIGVNLKQIYGQTEIVGIAYMHRDGDVRPDTVGKPLPGTECRIAESGEILSRSLSVTPGYFNFPTKRRNSSKAAGSIPAMPVISMPRSSGGDRSSRRCHAQSPGRDVQSDVSGKSPQIQPLH